MALRNQPYIPLYVQDYLTDEKLNECNASTQGIYIKIMCLMHKSEPYGTILLKQKDKQKGSKINNFACKLVKHLLFTEKEIMDALTELTNEGVLGIKDDELFQKRMIKDNDLSIKRAIAGKKGGEKTQFAKAKTEANSEYEDVVESDNEDILKIWRGTWKTLPSIPEQDETRKLIDKFGYDKTYDIMYEGNLEGFKKIKTLVNALDEKGNIKPRDSAEVTGRIVGAKETRDFKKMMSDNKKQIEKSGKWKGKIK